MQNHTTNNNTLINRLVFVFLAIHLAGWTLVPAIVRGNLPLDAIEGAIWGHQLEWGYDKNPFMNGWLTALATHLGGTSGWMIYLFSQISVVACLFSVWLLAKRILSPAYALLSILMLEGIQYYNFHAIDFNDNTLELGLWGFATYFFYLAVEESKLQRKNIFYWILTGFFAALGLMAKYYTLVLIAGMGLFLLIDPQARQAFRKPAPWVGLMVFLAVITPHVIWLTSHDYITVRYVFERGAGAAERHNHLFFPAQFAWQQFQVLLPGLVLFALFLIGKRPILASQRLKLSDFNRRFLLYVGLGPFLLTILVSLLFNVKLRAGWGMPLQSLWGVIIVALVQPYVSSKLLVRSTIITLVLMGVFFYAYSMSLLYSKDSSTANFPGTEVATRVTNMWHDRFHTKLEYLAGSRWAGGNVAYYSPDRPAVMIEWEGKRSPWINVAEMKKHGAIFIWDITGEEKLPDGIRKEFPTLEKAQTIEYHWLNDYYHLAPGKVGIAFLPPETLSHCINCTRHSRLHRRK